MGWPENKAAELGLSKLSWWKDWRGECVAIVASGPSTKKTDVEKLRDRIHVIAIKANVDLCPWADVVYGCDAAWWKHRNGLMDFKGIRLAWAADVCAKYKNLHKITIKETSKKKYVNEMLFDEPGVVGSGGNSGFQAINIAAQFGTTGIMLLGFDSDDRSGVHYYGRNNWAGANNPSASNFRTWRSAFYEAAPVLTSRGIDVINASPNSTLNCFTKMSIEDAFKRWGL